MSLYTAFKILTYPQKAVKVSRGPESAAGQGGFHISNSSERSEDRGPKTLHKGAHAQASTETLIALPTNNMYYFSR
jgi:hypothetical protein